MIFGFGFTKLPRQLEVLFSSMKSLKLRKMFLTVLGFLEDSKYSLQTEFEDEDDESVERGMIPWGSWDTVLSPLAEQAHNIVTLQLKILDFDHLLPEFLEYGLINTGCGWR